MNPRYRNTRHRDTRYRDTRAYSELPREGGPGRNYPSNRRVIDRLPGSRLAPASEKLECGHLLAPAPPGAATYRVCPVCDRMEGRP